MNETQAAPLLAAAPEMLKALGIALDALTDGETVEPHGYLTAISAVRTAIAKAEGK